MKVNISITDSRRQLIDKLGIQVDTDLVDYIDERYITRVTRANNIISVPIQPVMQVDKYGAGRDWCFLAVMTAIRNYFEGSHYTCDDMARMVLNKYEYEYIDRDNNGNVKDPTDESVRKINLSGKFNYSRSKTILAFLESMGYHSRLNIYDLSKKTQSNLITNLRGGLNLGNAVVIFTKLSVYSDAGDRYEENNNTGNKEIDSKPRYSHVMIVSEYNQDTGEFTVIDSSPPPDDNRPFTKLQKHKMKIPNNTSKILFDNEAPQTFQVGEKTVYYGHLAQSFHIISSNKLLDYVENHPLDQSIIDEYLQNKDNIQHTMHSNTPGFTLYSTLAYIYNSYEGTRLSASDVARNYLPSQVVDYMEASGINVLEKSGFSGIKRDMVDNIIGMRGYTKIRWNISWLKTNEAKFRRLMDCRLPNIAIELPDGSEENVEYEQFLWNNKKLYLYVFDGTAMDKPYNLGNHFYAAPLAYPMYPEGETKERIQVVLIDTVGEMKEKRVFFGSGSISEPFYGEDAYVKMTGVLRIFGVGQSPNNEGVEKDLMLKENSTSANKVLGTKETNR